MRIRNIVILILLIGIGFFLAKNQMVPKTTGLVNGHFQPCSTSPNCVCCCARDETHYIAPLPYASLDVIENYLKEHYTIQVVAKTPTYLHVVVTTKMMRFKDDLEFVVIEKNKICIRSASRVGYSDMGVNRNRIEELRAFLKTHA